MIFTFIDVDTEIVLLQIVLPVSFFYFLWKSIEKLIKNRQESLLRTVVLSWMGISSIIWAEDNLSTERFIEKIVLLLGFEEGIIGDHQRKSSLFFSFLWVVQPNTGRKKESGQLKIVQVRIGKKKVHFLFFDHFLFWLLSKLLFHFKGKNYVAVQALKSKSYPFFSNFSAIGLPTSVVIPWHLKMSNQWGIPICWKGQKTPL